MACNSAFALFKTPKWLHLSREEESFWTQLSRDFAIECDHQNPAVVQQIRWYQQHPKQLRRILKEAEPFIYYVYEQTHRKNLPAELALIPILESEYNPSIAAKSGATGLWQIMPGTARKFGLKINPSYDGRRDVTASTKAALTYLTYLYYYFNKDWLLALAAYDAGEGKIQTYAHKYSRNFWKLPLSKETREYVPKLLAIAWIIKQPGQYNLALPHVINEATLTEKAWKEAKVIDLTKAAQDLGVNDKVLRQLNPGIRQNIATVPRTLTLLVPGKEKQEASESDRQAVTLYENGSDHPMKQDLGLEQTSKVDSPEALPVTQQEKPKSTSNYKIRKGDTLNLIAKKRQVSVAEIKKINNLHSNTLEIGKTLRIPASPLHKSSLSKKTTYKVHNGDNLKKIAKKFGVPLKQLRQANQLTNEKQLQIGREIVIPKITLLWIQATYV